MKLVAIVRAPERPEDVARTVADAMGATLAEARMRLAPEPPALLARLEPDRADALVVRLRTAGLAALAVEARVPSDADRTIAHGVALTETGATFTPRFGAAMEIAWPDMLAILRGVRASRAETERTERTKGVSIGMAVVTGGLKVTRTTTRAVRSSEESIEQVILVYARDGRAALLSEEQLDFSFLGPALQPSRTANVIELSRRLRDGARGAFHDERLVRLGRRALPFVAASELRAQTRAAVVTSTDTSSSLDVLAEILRQAVATGLLT